MYEAVKAAEQLEAEGVSAEVIDLRSLAPLDMDTLLASVAKTTRAVVVHEAVRTCGAGAEIAARLHEELHGQLSRPVRRVTRRTRRCRPRPGWSPCSTPTPRPSSPPAGRWREGGGSAVTTLARELRPRTPSSPGSLALAQSTGHEEAS